MIDTRLQTLWVYLSTAPLTGLTITLLAYLIAYTLHQRLRQHPLSNPVLVAVILLVMLLQLSQTPYSRYFEGAQFIHFLLGAATVALAVPLSQQINQQYRLFIPILVSMTLGILTGTGSVLLVSQQLGVDLLTQLSLVPRAVTAPVAMGIAEELGGLPSLAAVLAVLTGILGAIMGEPLLRRLGIRHPVLQGIAIGNSAHGIGTARAFSLHPQMGAFAGLAMAVAALLNALLLPWWAPWLIALFK